MCSPASGPRRRIGSAVPLPSPPRPSGGRGRRSRREACARRRARPDRGRRCPPSFGRSTAWSPPTGRESDQGARTRILYVSPLKALGVDVERNLRSPLVGIAQSASRLGCPCRPSPWGSAPATRPRQTADGSWRSSRHPHHDPRVALPHAHEPGVQTLTGVLRPSSSTRCTRWPQPSAAPTRGEPRAARRTAAGRPARSGPRAAHRPVRHGATHRGGRAVPRRRGARGDRRATRDEDFRARGRRARRRPHQPPPAARSDAESDSGRRRGGCRRTPELTGSVWAPRGRGDRRPRAGARSTIVFANSRRLAERLTARLNEIYSERLGLDLPSPTIPAATMAQSGATAGAEPVLATKAHHGSVSKEQRAIVEDELKSGCCAASSRPAASSSASTWARSTS